MNTKTHSDADLADWRPEDEQFWESTGKKIAYRGGSGGGVVQFFLVVIGYAFSYSGIAHVFDFIK